MKKSFLILITILAIFVFIGCQDLLAPSGYNVIYDGNGNTSGSVPVDSNNYEEETTATVLSNTGSLVRTTYTFSGWNTAADGSGTDRAASSTFSMGASDVTLYAQWNLSKVGIVLPAGDETRWEQDAARLLTAFEGKTSAEVLYSEGSSTVEKANVDIFIAQGIDVLVICPQESEAGAVSASAAQQLVLQLYPMTGLF